MHHSMARIYGIHFRPIHRRIAQKYYTILTIFGAVPQSLWTIGKWSKALITVANGTLGMAHLAVVMLLHIVTLKLSTV